MSEGYKPRQQPESLTDLVQDVAIFTNALRMIAQGYVHVGSIRTELDTVGMRSLAQEALEAMNRGR